MDRFEKIEKEIRSFISLSEEELQLLLDSFELITLDKNELFVKEGEVCDYIGFVNRGMLINYKTIENEKELAIEFAFEGEFITDNKSRLTNCPSLINIKAIEPTELFIIEQHKLLDLYEQIPKFEKFGRILLEHEYLKMCTQIEEDNKFCTKFRYESLLQRNPEILKKVPLSYVADYLLQN